MKTEVTDTVSCHRVDHQHPKAQPRGEILQL